MMNLAHNLIISAAPDSLLIRPTGERADESRAFLINYGDSHISSRHHQRDEQDDTRSLEAYGVVGLLNLVSSTYLITIVEREEVANIRDSPIYKIRDVALIPLTSQEDAARKIIALQQKSHSTIDSTNEQSDLSDVDEIDVSALSESEDTDIDKTTGLKSSAVSGMKDVVSEATVSSKTKYSRVAGRWFSKSNQARPSSQRRLARSNGDEEAGSQELGTWGQDDGNPQAHMSNAEPHGTAAWQSKPASSFSARQPTVLETLLPRILRSTRILFSSGGFYFSYGIDISQSLRAEAPAPSQTPLWKSFKRMHFWNRHLLSRFETENCEELLLPIMQGFVGQRNFSLHGRRHPADLASSGSGSSDTAQKGIVSPTETDEKEKEDHFQLTLISRRSTDRAGLRYLRRGVDEHGHVANHLETEQILTLLSLEKSQKIFSVLQVRGSIPLFFSQTPYSFKPVPVFYGSESTNQDAMTQHLFGLRELYGNVQIVSLVDKHGTEVSIGEAYEKHVELFNQNKDEIHQVGFEWFDFHRVCKGMKFENVSILLASLEEALAGFGWTIMQDGHATQQQSGIIRTNCMDCLDRTNVAQSAVGGWALQKQLQSLGLDIDIQRDASTQWFNTLWADNGDAISKQYAGTAALKGDFTRTRQRKWTGALSDFSLTLTRYYNNIFGDYFLQTEIDFLLGNGGPELFAEFETTLTSKDYALDMRRVRHRAIESCAKIALPDSQQETFSAGWTLSCPHEANVLRSARFEECLLLVTNAALYFCRFDWATEKVGSFERVDLRDILQIWRGPYVTSALSTSHLDEEQNVGFALRYSPGPRGLVRTNTRSLQNEAVVKDENSGKSEIEKQKNPELDKSRLLAFKVLPVNATAAYGLDDEEIDRMTPSRLAERICTTLAEAMTTVAHHQSSADGDTAPAVLQVEERAVVSAAEAKKSTGYVVSIGNSLKRLVWS